MRALVSPRPSWRRRWTTGVTAAILGLAGPLTAAGVAHADAFVPLSGAGSTWSEIAFNAWKNNVAQFGLRVNYAGNGSSDGRTQFKVGTVDFAVSEIPYGITDNGAVDPPPARKFAYMPIVAGGTSLMYNLKIGGQRVTNLRLSGPVIAKIFTNVITDWSDPAIAADNPGLRLPARKIIPVVRADGSGSTAQFTAWMAKQQSSTWDGYCAKVGRAVPCGLTSNYPVASGTNMTALALSSGVAGYVAQDQGEGAITYVEFAYALGANFPVAKVLNASNIYVEPTPQSVAVALLDARINSDESSQEYLTQKLDGVYNSADPRAYPLSSYSYMIVPLALENGFSTDKGYTLGRFAYYFLCQGQQQVPDLGYSPLPINLVQAGFDQVRRIPGVNVQELDLTKCNNPTFAADGSNTLADTAPQPPACDKLGPAQCTTGTGGDSTATPVSAAGPADNSGNAPEAPGAPEAPAAPDTAGAPAASGAAPPSNGSGSPGGPLASPGASAPPTVGGSSPPQSGSKQSAGAKGIAPAKPASGAVTPVQIPGATVPPGALAPTAPGGRNNGFPALAAPQKPATRVIIDADTGEKKVVAVAPGARVGGGSGALIPEGSGDAQAGNDAGTGTDTGVGGAANQAVAGGTAITAVPVSMSRDTGSGFTQAMMVLAGLLLLALIAAPPLVARALAARKSA